MRSTIALMHTPLDNYNFRSLLTLTSQELAFTVLATSHSQRDDRSPGLIRDRILGVRVTQRKCVYCFGLADVPCDKRTRN